MKKNKLEIAVAMGYGDNCDCLEYGQDCVVLYGGDCDWRFKGPSH